MHSYNLMFGLAVSQRMMLHACREPHPDLIYDYYIYLLIYIYIYIYI